MTDDKLIDLRSDTVTQPTPGMREAIATAVLGDDVYGEDPTINRLQDIVAERLGKEAALFVPSGTMANHISARTHCEHGDEVIIDAGGHSYNFETGGTAALAGVQVHPIQTDAGIFTPEQMNEVVRPAADHFPRTRMVCIENTHNYGGGTVWSLDQVRAVSDAARKLDLIVHLDGARLFNASVASGTPVSEYAACVDSVSICLSKGLGAPVGSLVAGSRPFIVRAHRFRKMFGGGMRQAGLLAAAGIYALEHHVERLADDHANAKLLGETLSAKDGLRVDVDRIQTNILFLHIERDDVDSTALVKTMRDKGVLANAAGSKRLRLVTHLDLSRDAIVEAGERIGEAIKAA